MENISENVRSQMRKGVLEYCILCILSRKEAYASSILGIQLPMAMTPLIKLLPYVFTIIVLILTSIRKKRENQPPAGLGITYFREER